MNNHYKSGLFLAGLFLCSFSSAVSADDFLSNPFGFESDSYGSFTLGTGVELSHFGIKNTDSDADRRNSDKNKKKEFICYKWGRHCVNGQRFSTYIEGVYTTPSVVILDDLLANVSVGFRRSGGGTFDYSLVDNKSYGRIEGVNKNPVVFSSKSRFSITPSLSLNAFTVYYGLTYDIQDLTFDLADDKKHTASIGGMGYVVGARVSMAGLLGPAFSGLSVGGSYGERFASTLLEREVTNVTASADINYSIDF